MKEERDKADSQLHTQIQELKQQISSLQEEKTGLEKLVSQSKEEKTASDDMVVSLEQELSKANEKATSVQGTFPCSSFFFPLRAYNLCTDQVSATRCMGPL